jgi:uncharacterized protein (TIGR02147 family)
MKETLLKRDQVSVYRNWYTIAVWNALSMMSVKNSYGKLAGCFNPALSVAQVREAIDTLETAGMIKRSPSGRWVKVARKVRLGDKFPWERTLKYQEQVCALGRRAVRAWPREERDISTIAFSTTAKGYAEMRDVLAQARKRVFRILARSHGADRVGQVNLQLFPLAKQ